MFQSNSTSTPTNSNNNNTSHYCPQYSMGNCSLCNNANYGNDYFQYENNNNDNNINYNEDASFQNLYNMSSSLSYPLLSREFHNTLTANIHSQNINSTDTVQPNMPINYDTNLLIDTIKDFGWPYFEKSTSAFSLCSHAKSNFNSSYRDCRLRYIKQTRKLQKYLRVTPEGHILVNNPRIEHHHLHHSLHQSPSNQPVNNSTVDAFGCKGNLNKFATNGHDLCNNPFGSLISTPKMRRIYTAFWNLEPRESVGVHRLPSSKTTSFSESTTSSLKLYTNDYDYYDTNNEQDSELKFTMHNNNDHITSNTIPLEPVMENSINDANKLSDLVMEPN
ncbi:hypothetical protein MN116_005862 [Schistosoma mekongi]|uniref:Uncharacterized protein n=1 Tax=Schistosoma mekongi TaxID=38744 RepID=A0AAE1ZB95_SCHME|nr:hypothetical protein MN116_005862 [Schistosoma mekongi]